MLRSSNHSRSWKPTDEQILGTIATNLGGPILCVRSAIPMMERGSHIINVSSESVDLPFPHLSRVPVLQSRSRALYHSLHRELEPSGIRVTIVRAGQMMEPGKVWNADPAAQSGLPKPPWKWVSTCGSGPSPSSHR